MITTRKLCELALWLEHRGGDPITLVVLDDDGKTTRLTDPSIAHKLEIIAQKINELNLDPDEPGVRWDGTGNDKYSEFD